MRLHDFFEAKKKMSAKDDPCWDGYHMVGKKEKNGREVPNCVPGKKGVTEGFGSNYAEQLAQQVFDNNPNIKDENQVLNLGYSIAKRDLGSRAQGIFRDEDFPSDFVSAYFYLQKQGVAEVKGESPESELERLKMRQDAEHGSAPLRRQAATQARIRELEKQIKNKKQGVAEGFKNTYEVNDRVETPMGSGTIVAVSPNINVDGKIRVKLDDPSRAGEDGKHKDTFTLTTMQVKHMATSESDMSGIMHAAQHLNKSFIITADVAEGGRKKYRVRAQSERVAKEKFAKHYSMAKIVDVKEED